LSLSASYTFLAPLYDLAIERIFFNARARSLSWLPASGSLQILINGIGTGLDLPHVPVSHRYTGVDLTKAMLDRASKRRGSIDLALVEGDSLKLPFKDETFDHAVLHLIVAIVPDASACLRETARVLKSGGTIFLLDKFLRSGQHAPLRRILSPAAGRLVTRLDVVFEQAIEKTPELAVVSDEPLLLNGWIRQIRLEKSRQAQPRRHY
jgi:SAM-dependent methyltransferase